MPDVSGMRGILEAYDDVSSEREGGFSVRCIPLSKIGDYIERYHLPDWWEPVLREADKALVKSMSEDKSDGSASQSEEGSSSK